MSLGHTMMNENRTRIGQNAGIFWTLIRIFLGLQLTALFTEELTWLGRHNDELKS